MNQNFRFTLYASIFTLFLFNRVQAQHTGNSYHVDQRSLVPSLFVTNFDKTAFPNSHRAGFNTKVIADFVQRYLAAENVHWYKSSPKYLLAFFNENDVRTRALYRNDGSWLYSIRTYTEEHLPTEVSNQVKQMFHGFLITSIDEVKTVEQVSYQVHLHDDNFWKNIWFCNGEIKVTEELEILH